MIKANLFTHGEWKYTDSAGAIDKHNGNMGAFYVVAKKGPLIIMDFGDCGSYYPVEGNEPEKPDIDLITTAGTTATKLSEMGYDAVKLIEDFPLILIKVLNGDIDGALKDIEYLKVKQCQR